MKKITPCLWFDTEAEQAAKYYTSIFKNARIVSILHYGEEGREVGREPGSVLMVSFELDGHSFTALNGGPQYKLNEAVSFQVDCKDQEEVDYYWDALVKGGDTNAQACSWLKDKYGLSWQIVPRRLLELINDPDKAKAGRAMASMMQMKKIIIADLERAAAG